MDRNICMDRQMDRKLDKKINKIKDLFVGSKKVT